MKRLLTAASIMAVVGSAIAGSIVQPLVTINGIMVADSVTGSVSGAALSQVQALITSNVPPVDTSFATNSLYATNAGYAAQAGTSQVAVVALGGWPVQTQQVYTAQAGTSQWANAGNFATTNQGAEADTAVQPDALASYTTWYDSTQVCLSVIGAGGYATQGWVTGQLGGYYTTANTNGYINAGQGINIAAAAAAAGSNYADQVSTVARTSAVATAASALAGYLPLAGGTISGDLYVFGADGLSLGGLGDLWSIAKGAWDVDDSLYFTNPNGDLWILPATPGPNTFLSTTGSGANLTGITAAQVGADASGLAAGLSLNSVCSVNSVTTAILGIGGINDNASSPALSIDPNNRYLVSAAGRTSLNYANSYNVIIGDGASVAYATAYSISIGVGAVCWDNYCTAIGYGAIAANNPSIALGVNAEAGGQYSMAIGSYATAMHDYAEAIGYDTQNVVPYTMALGGYSSVANPDTFLLIGHNGIYDRGNSPSPALSIDPVARRLYASDGTTVVLDFNNGNLLFTDNSGGADWVGAAPADVNTAINRIADCVKTLNGGKIP